MTTNDQPATLFSVVRPISFYQSDDVASTDGLTYTEARQLADRYRRNGLDVAIVEYESEYPHDVIPQPSPWHYPPEFQK